MFDNADELGNAVFGAAYHTSVHWEIGGAMSSQTATSGATAFWILHSNLDRYYRCYQIECQCQDLVVTPYWGPNFSFFSFTSYFLMNNGYLNSEVFHTVLDAYKLLEESCPDQHFYIMECADKHGGKLSLHKTHQNGMSVDFMVPKKNNFGIEYNKIGLLHYLLEFDDAGLLEFDKRVNIDFESMAQHILTLQAEGKKHGIRIRMVILKLELKEEFFKTKSGKLVEEKQIYFAQSLPKWTNRMHDDHYHIDFVKIR